MTVCDRCHRSSAFCVTESGVERWVCETCLDFVLGEHGLSEIATAMVRVTPRHDACLYCGTKPAQAIETGLVGCPLCYESLDDVVWKTLNVARTTWSRMDVW